MDFALKHSNVGWLTWIDVGFNPCFDGFCSKTLPTSATYHRFVDSFNPCFDGFCSKTLMIWKDMVVELVVSILVLMDFALKPCFYFVFIIVPLCFNPCFDGFCSKTHVYPVWKLGAVEKFQSLF